MGIEKVRLNKYLSQIGYCSRRAADNLVEEGRVTVNGNKAEMGMKVSDDDQIAMVELLDAWQKGAGDKDVLHQVGVHHLTDLVIGELLQGAESTIAGVQYQAVQLRVGSGDIAELMR